MSKFDLRYMAEILPIRRKTLSNSLIKQFTNQTIKICLTFENNRNVSNFYEKDSSPRLRSRSEWLGPKHEALNGRLGWPFNVRFIVFRPTREFFTYLETSRHRCRWRAANFDLCSALLVIEQWEFFCVPHLLWHGASIMTLTPFVERLAVELSIHVFKT